MRTPNELIAEDAARLQITKEEARALARHPSAKIICSVSTTKVRIGDSIRLYCYILIRVEKHEFTWGSPRGPFELEI